MIVIGFLSLAILVGGVIYWLFAMGLHSNLLNISLTAGALMVISVGFMVSTRIVGLLGGIISLLSSLHF